MMETDSTKIKNLLQGLGKYTKRGIKTCVKCGFNNGTRAVFCKNMLCDAILKPTEDSSKSIIKACKLITDKDTQVYSVCVNDKGPDHRGFVQIPLNSSAGGLCFVEACPKTFNSNILKCHEKDQIGSLEKSLPCQHIEVVKQCTTLASSLSLNPIIIDQMNLLPGLKQELWNFLTDNNYNTSGGGPCVQRISRSIFVVKCKTSPKHPLGYLHVTIYNNVKHKDKPDYRHYCACPVEYKDLSSAGLEINEKKCIHYYAVICAFASDQKLYQEFSQFMQMEQVLTLFVDQYLPTNDVSDQLGAIFDLKTADILVSGDNVMGQELEVELIASGRTDSEILSEMDNVLTFLHIEYESPSDITTDTNTDLSTLITSSNSDYNQFKPIAITNSTEINQKQQQQKVSSTDNIVTTTATVSKDISDKSNVEFKSKKRKLNVNKVNNTKNNTQHGVNIDQNSQTKKIMKYIGRKIPLKPQDTSTKTKETRASIDFLHWVAGISERIYQEMHFKFDGSKPKTLIFPTPMVFYECLRERMATLGTKRRLPNSTVAFVSKTPPVGTFTKFVWHLTSIIHVKQVLDNPFVPLKITRSFIDSGNGVYTPSEPDDSPTPLLLTPATNNLQKIKPFELKTYLNVGKTSSSQHEPVPFIIEFIPDILPISKIGELKIIFQYGHLRPPDER